MAQSGGAAGRGVGRGGAKETFWREHLARQPRSGLSIRAYCARHGLSQPSFYAWRSELARRDAEHRRRPAFVPVIVGAGASEPTVEFQLPPLRMDLSSLYTSGEVTLTAIPEPSTLAFAAVTAVGLIFRVRGRRRNA